MSTPTAPRTETAVSPRSASTALRRCAAATAVALTTMAATVVLAPQSSAAAVTAPMQNLRASAAVTELTAGGPGLATDIPDDFTSTFGYRPTLVDGLLANPQGDCSSPVPLPAVFNTACKAHDLGYDLLRYADQRGEPLGPWARQALDTTLATRMHEACGAYDEPFARAGCDAMATIANTAVDLNSRRQHYGAPVVETLFGAKVSGSTPNGPLLAILATGLLGFAMIIATLRRARPRTSTNSAAALEVQP
ncbi:hypothetical protein [Nocardia sp. NPDC052566]|uniref:hypothetical protein n=1 Tax=Nocardia sp. NPDC052566 TaxID=3364330 RepID=UPI0037C780E9